MLRCRCCHARLAGKTNEVDMTTMNIAVPESLLKFAREVAQTEHVSVDQLVANALAEKISIMRSEEYLKTRSAQGSREHLNTVLKMVQKRPPLSGDARK